MIILLNPQSARWKYRLPLSVLALGAVLEGKYPYQIIDGNLDGDLRGTLLGTIQKLDIRYLGITVMPGPQLQQAIRLSQELEQVFRN